MKVLNWHVLLLGALVGAFAIQFFQFALSFKSFPPPDMISPCEVILAEELPKASNLGRWMRCLRDDNAELKARITELEKKR